MISATDVPACPACGSREVHPVQGRDDRTLYACRQCGRDNTDAWRNIQPPRNPKAVIGPPDQDHPDPVIDFARKLSRERAGVPDPLDLGIGATIKATT